MLDELARGVREHPMLAEMQEISWLRRVGVDTLIELAAFAEYARILGSGERDVGEASTLAWAEVNHAVAVVDERAGTRTGRNRGVEVHGTLWLVAEGYRADLLSADRVETLVDALTDTEAWFPCRGAEFLEWARSEGLF